MKFSIKDFFSKCDQICSFLRIWPHLLEKSLMKIFIFCAVLIISLDPECTSDFLFLSSIHMALLGFHIGMTHQKTTLHMTLLSICKQTLAISMYIESNGNKVLVIRTSCFHSCFRLLSCKYPHFEKLRLTRNLLLLFL